MNLRPRRFWLLPVAALLFAGFAIASISGSRTVASLPASGDPTPVRHPSPAVHAAQDSLLRRYPFLKLVRVRDSSGRQVDIFGRAEGC